MKGSGELIVYLDFDGVLHHDNVLWSPSIGAYLSAPNGHVLFQHAGLLEQLLEPYPQVKIVLSTTWAVRYGRTKAAKNLRPALRSRVIGSTFPTRMAGQAQYWAASRGMQVWSDVLRRKPRDWLALDDDAKGWAPEHAARFVRTHRQQGLSDAGVQSEFKSKLQEMCKEQA